MVSIGPHVHDEEPLRAAKATESPVAQFFLGDPQGWAKPSFPGGDAGALRTALDEAGVQAYIHAPYRINVASTNNRIRIPSRKLLGQYLAAAAEIGARGVIVHGGHVTADADADEGYANWRKAVERTERPVPMLIENTAGGDHAMARGLDAVARLWDAIGERGGGRRRGRVLPGHVPCLRQRRGPGRNRGPGEGRRPAGSTWCTATTPGMSSAPAGTGTPGWSRARSTRSCWWT